MLDVACGTGIAARLAAREIGMTGEVAGLDLNDLSRPPPVAGAIAALSEARRAALGDDVRKALLAYAYVVIAMR